MDSSVRCIYCLQPHADIYHGPRKYWDWAEIAKGHAKNCVWVRTKGETGMSIEQQQLLIDTIPKEVA